MSKKRRKRAGSFEDRLAVQLKAGDPGELEPEAQNAGLDPERFTEVFQEGCDLLGKGADPRKAVELPAVFQVAFVKLAEMEEDDDQINDILAMTDAGEVKKEAKRALHRMRSRGLDVSIPEEAGSSVLERRILPEDPDLPCYLSPVSGNGSRIVFLARYVRGGVGVFQAELNDEEGLVEFAGGTIGRSRYRNLSRDLLGDPKRALLEITYEEAWQRISLAAAHNRETSRPLPEGYLDAKNSLPEPKKNVLESGTPEGTPPSDPRSLFDRDEIGHDQSLIREAAELHDLEEFSDWMLDEETLKTVQSKLEEVESGQVTINDQQKVEQVQKILDQAVESLLEGEERRTRYQNRLFEMAEYLHRTGRTEPAKKAAAAAWQLSLEGFSPAESPFFDRMTRKLFRSADEIVKEMGGAEKAERKKKTASDPGKLIVPP
jgi:hypothetical protein